MQQDWSRLCRVLVRGDKMHDTSGEVGNEEKIFFSSLPQVGAMSSVDELECPCVVLKLYVQM